MNIELASKIVSIRPAIESLIIRCTQEPNDIINHSESVEKLCNLIRLLSDQQLEHILCEKINENNNNTTESTNSNFNQSSSEYRPNELFPSNRGYNQRSFYGGRNRPFNRYNYRGNNNTSQQQYRPQNNMSSSSFSFSTDLSSVQDNSSSSFNNKRQYDNAFYSSTSSPMNVPPPTSSYQSEWNNNRGGYSHNYRGTGGYGRFPKRSRPYNY
ncbi:unnamed protein product [Rotaria sp. Silwood1]|nr:unnamed protein product [Rotaria sp. Silwood1]